MIKMLSSRKAQNLTELALLIGVVAMVFISMEVYFRRGLQSKIKNMSDNYMTGDKLLGAGNLAGTAKQEIYSIDTHNYLVQQSGTTTVSNGRVAVRGIAGGGRVETSDVNTIVPASTSSSEVNY